VYSHHDDGGDHDDVGENDEGLDVEELMCNVAPDVTPGLRNKPGAPTYTTQYRHEVTSSMVNNI
jgi:hypothetical protein